MGIDLLWKASAKLHGYLVHRWFADYFAMLADDARRLGAGDLGPDAVPEKEVDYEVALDIGGLHVRELAYSVGAYLYIHAGHAKANHLLGEEMDTSRILYLRGFDYQFAQRVSAGRAISVKTTEEILFTSQLQEHVADVPGVRLFKPLSPEDFQSETTVAQAFFFGHPAYLLVSSSPSFYLNANYWQADMARIVAQMDHFVVYVSSLTDSVMWELDLLKRMHLARNTTVVFDEDAIAAKERYIGVHQRVTAREPHAGLWPGNRGGAQPADVRQLRARLAESFVVVTRDEFFATIGERLQAIAQLGVRKGRRGSCDALKFRFEPAVPSHVLAELRVFDHRLEVAIEQSLTSRSITNLCWFINRIQLKIMTALLLGDQKGAGRAMAVLAGVVEAVGFQLKQSDPGLRSPVRAEVFELLRQIFSIASTNGPVLLSLDDGTMSGDDRECEGDTGEDAYRAGFDACQSYFEDVSQARESVGIIDGRPQVRDTEESREDLRRRFDEFFKTVMGKDSGQGPE